MRGKAERNAAVVAEVRSGDELADPEFYIDLGLAVAQLDRMLLKLDMDHKTAQAKAEHWRREAETAQRTLAAVQHAREVLLNHAEQEA